KRIFPKGAAAPPDYFSGAAWIQTLVDDGTFNFLVARVTFEPKARNNWHTHPAGQILLVTEGTGFYQEKGKPVHVLRKGDVVKIPPAVEHWHGASPESQFVHVAITMKNERGPVLWLER